MTDHKDRMPQAYRIAMEIVSSHLDQLTEEIENASSSDAQVGAYLLAIELSNARRKFETWLLEANERERRK